MKVKKMLSPYFEWYDDGYSLKIEGKKIPASIGFWDHICEGVENISLDISDQEKEKMPDHLKGRKFGRTIVPRKEIKKVSPNKINNVKFWKSLDPKYKLLAVCGAPVKTPFEANKLNLFAAKDALKIITPILQEKINIGQPVKVLEIGYGYGGFTDWVHSTCGEAHLKKTGNFFPFDKFIHYYGIDLVKRIDTFSNLFETDGWEIPEEVPNNLDIVYSMNVFQHLSKEQRMNYFNKAYSKLGEKGVMVFSSFIMTEENKDSYVWGLKDENGTGYCQFFNQATEVDNDVELKEDLKEMGFEIDEFKVHGINQLFCALSKRKKIATKEDPFGEEIWDDELEIIENK